MRINADIHAYNAAQAPQYASLRSVLAAAINRHLPGAESKIWHRHPVWFLEGNPIVGYSKLKGSVRLLFLERAVLRRAGSAEGPARNGVQVRRRSLH